MTKCERCDQSCDTPYNDGECFGRMSAEERNAYEQHLIRQAYGDHRGELTEEEVGGVLGIIRKIIGL